LGNKFNQNVHGFILLDKPPGVTSRKCVDAILKGFRGFRVGHSGTLDPFATGLLPICVGRATKLVDFLREGVKTYYATMTLGISTDTFDVTGEITEQKMIPSDLTRDEIVRISKTFLGCIEQIPPMYSARKVNGIRLYKLARKNIEVERKSRKINIYELNVIEFTPPDVSFYVTCSEGTYIRSLGADLAKSLGTVGTLKSLRRSQIGSHSVENAVQLNEFQRSIEEGDSMKWLLPTDKITAHLPRYVIKQASICKFKHGREMACSDFIDMIDTDKNGLLFNVFDQNNTFLGLVEHIRRDTEGKSVLKTARLIDI